MHMTSLRPTSIPRSFFSLVALTLVVGVQAAQAPQPPRPPDGPQVTFKVDVSYVEVTATAVDASGRFVTDLTKDELQVIEDGKPQTITNFSLVNLPVAKAEKALFATSAPEPDVQGNDRPFDGRLYLLVLDDLHVDFANTGKVRDLARRFIERSFGEGDLAAVVSTGGRTEAAQELTSNRRLLLAAIDRFAGRGLPSATANFADSVSITQPSNRVSARPPTDADAPERINTARATLSAIARMADLLTGVHGRRKAIILFSENPGFSLGNEITSGATGTLEPDARSVIAAATRSSVAIYGVDPRGLLGGDTAALQLEQQNVLESLRYLSTSTGGFAVYNTNNIDDGFERILQDNSTYYVLGYYPPGGSADGKYRKIAVRTTRAGVTIQARQGYVAPARKADAAAPADTVSAPLRDGVASVLPVSGLRLSAFAAPFKGPGPDASVTLVLVVDGRDLSFAKQAAGYSGALELSIVALGSQGKAAGRTNSGIPMPLRPESYQQVQQHGIRIVSKIDLKPGRYQLRIGAMDKSSERVGVVHYDLEVPDFSSLPLSMSGLMLTSSRAGMVPTASGSAVAELQKILPGPPTLAREFQAGEELALFAEVYDTDTKAPHAVDIVTTVRADEGREVFRREDQRQSAELKDGAGFPCSLRIPLKGATPGLYVLRVEARSRLGKGPTAVREIQFRIAG
jgi:VWFA-related protein